jgi:hypothetical protein
MRPEIRQEARENEMHVTCMVTPLLEAENFILWNAPHHRPFSGRMSKLDTK